MPRDKDLILFQGSFHTGIIRDTARHAGPANSVYDAVDLFLERPGVAYKRGGSERHSDAVGAGTSVAWVGTIHIPTRVVALLDTGVLYDVTSEGGPEAVSIATVGYAPTENSPLYVDRLILCDPAVAAGPKVVFYDTGGMAMAVDDLFDNSPPHARHSVIHESFVVLGRDDTFKNRIWFWPDPDLEPDVDTAEVFVDMTNEITGLASISGTLLTFSPKAIERVIGSVPPGRPGENMSIQTLEHVGTTDARSIVHAGSWVVFAGEDGVFRTNGYGVDSLTSGTVESYWRTLFPASTVRQVIGGLLTRDLYKVDILDSSNVGVDSFLFHIATGACVARLSNTFCRSYAQGRTEQESIELYGAANDEGYVNRFRSMLAPAWANRADADGTTVEPTLELVLGDAGVLKKLGKGRLSYYVPAVTGTQWQALHAYSPGDLIVPSSVGQVWEVTGTTDTGVSGTDEPDWSLLPNVDDIFIETTPPHTSVTWTNRGPQLAVSTAPGLRAETFTEQKSFVPGSKRSPFDVLYDNTQAVTVRIEQTGPTAATEIYAVDIDALPYEAGVTGGQ